MCEKENVQRVCTNCELRHTQCELAIDKDYLKQVYDRNSCDSFQPKRCISCEYMNSTLSKKYCEVLFEDSCPNYKKVMGNHGYNKKRGRKSKSSNI